MAPGFRDPSSSVAAVGLAVALFMGLGGAGGGDPVAAQALVEHAQRESHGDLAHPAWLDAARELSRLRPWQNGWAEARITLDAIASARRAQLDPTTP